MTGCFLANVKYKMYSTMEISEDYEQPLAAMYLKLTGKLGEVHGNCPYCGSEETPYSWDTIRKHDPMQKTLWVLAELDRQIVGFAAIRNNTIKMFGSNPPFLYMFAAEEMMRMLAELGYDEYEIQLRNSFTLGFFHRMGCIIVDPTPADYFSGDPVYLMRYVRQVKKIE